MLTAPQRAEVLRLAALGDPEVPHVTDDDIWYGFLSSLFAAGKTLKDLKLSPAQQPEIMACLRQAPSTTPRKFSRRGERLARSLPDGTTPDPT